MNTTKNLYRNVMATGSIFFVIALFCKTPSASATEFSPLMGIGQENFSFGIEDVQPKQISFEPNIVGVFRLGINAFGFGVGYSFRGSDKDLNSSKGSTDFFDLQLGYQAKHWGIDSFYQTYKGFYTSNTETIQLFPDLKFTHYALMGRFATDDGEFSVGGLVDQSEDIKATSGKYYLVGGVRHHTMESDTSLLQLENAGIKPEMENLRKMRVTSLNLGFGAGKYWVSTDKYFVGLLVDIIGTLGAYNYETVTDSTSANETSLSFNSKFGVGYAGDVWKWGVGTSADSTTLKSPGSTIVKPAALRALLYIRTIL